MQGTNDPTRVELLDAAALCRHLVPRARCMPSWPTTAKTCSLRAVRRPVRVRVGPALGPGRSGGHGDGAAGARRGCRTARRHGSWPATSPGRWRRAGPDRSGLPSDGADLVAQQAARLRPSRAVFEAVRAVITQTGVLAGRQRRALDRPCWTTRSPPKTRSPSWWRPSGGCVGFTRPQGRWSLPPMTTTRIRASPLVPGTTPRREPGW